MTLCLTGTCGRGAIHTGSLCNEQKWHLSLPSPCRLHRKASHMSNKHKVFLGQWLDIDYQVYWIPQARNLGVPETCPIPFPPHPMNRSAPRPARGHSYPPFSLLVATTLTCLSYSYLSLPNCALHVQILLSTPLPIHFPPGSQSLGHMMSFTRITFTTHL